MGGACGLFIPWNEYSLLGFATEDHGDLARRRSCSVVRETVGVGDGVGGVGGVGGDGGRGGDQLQDVLLVLTGRI